MQQQQRFTFALALVFALISGGLFWAYLKQIDKPQAQVAQRIVFVASKDIPAKTALTPSMLESLTRPVSSVDPDAIGTLAEIQDKVALTSIPTGATIVKSRIGKASNDAVATSLHLGLRAVTIPIDQIRGVANLIQPGDHVDVMAVQHGLSQSQPNKVQTIMRGVLVIAMGKTTEQVAFANKAASSDQTIPDATNVTLALNPKDAEELATADSQATLRLALRPTKEAVPKVVAQPFVALTPPPTAAPKMNAPAAPPAPAKVITTVLTPAPNKGLAITVIDGDHIVGGDK